MTNLDVDDVAHLEHLKVGRHLACSLVNKGMMVTYTNDNEGQFYQSYFTNHVFGRASRTYNVFLYVFLYCSSFL